MSERPVSERGSGLSIRGAAQVVQFNWPKVLAGFAASGVGLLLWRRLPWLARLVVLGAGFWTPVSLFASWWVYDVSPLRHWRFFADRLPRPPRRVLLVVAGFDEVSPVLGEVFAGAEIDVVDVVDQPGASVRRARRLYPADAPIVAPAELGAGQTYDLIVFAQSAHEIRDSLQRHAMFAAARAAVGETGSVVVVEHVRDLANVIAFGPGSAHFQTAAVWRASFVAGGLRTVDHSTVTGLVHCWVLSPGAPADVVR